MNARKISGQAGFTLVELIIVILVLGVLASIAIPKFINLGGDARYAKMQGITGSVKSAVAIVHGAALVRNLPNATGQTLTMDGGSVVNVAYLYPDGTAGGIPVAAGFDPNTTPANNTDALTVTIAGGVVTVVPTAAATPGSCTLSYTAATGVAVGPVVSLPTTASNSTC